MRTANQFIAMGFKLMPKPKAGPWFSQASSRISQNPYNLGELVQHESGTLELSKNESAFGPGPKAKQARHELSKNPLAGKYADPQAHALNAAIATAHGLAVADPKVAVISTPGASTSLNELAGMLLEPGRNAVSSQYAYKPFEAAVRLSGAEGKVIPSPNGAVNLNAMLKAIDAHTSVVYLDNPGNPTGLVIDKDELNTFMTEAAKRNPRITFIIDAAYAPFARDGAMPDLPQLVRDHNAVVLGTLSKIHALPDVRAAFAFCSPAMKKAWDDFRPIQPVSLEAQMVGVAAVEDDYHVNLCRTDNAKARDQLEGGLAKRGISYKPSETNFVLLHVDGGNVPAIVTYLYKEHQIEVRDPKTTKDAFRITFPKSGEQTDRVLAAIDEAMNAGLITTAGSAASAKAFAEAGKVEKKESKSLAKRLHLSRFTPATA
jgi:histidinol-phosphate aminotransferase